MIVMKCFLVLTTLLLYSFCVFATSPLAKTTKPQSSYQKTQRVSHDHLMRFITSLIERKNYDQAITLLTMVQKRKTDASDEEARLISFLLALAYFNNGACEEATDIYRSMLGDDPTLDKVRFQLSRSLAKCGNFRAAQHHLEILQLSKQLNAESKDQLQNYLLQLKQQSGWRYNFSLESFYNDNVNNSANVDRISVGNAIFNVDNDPVASFGVATRLSTQYTANINEHLTYLSAIGLSFLDYKNNDFDDLNLFVSQGLGFGEVYRHKLKLRFDKRSYGGKTLYHAPSFSHTLTTRLRENSQLKLGYEVIYRDYNKDREAFKGRKHRLFTGYKYAFSPATYGEITLSHYADLAKADFQSYDLYGISTSLYKEWQFANLTTSFSFNYNDRQHRKVDPIFQLERQDDIYGINATIIKKDINFLGFAAGLNLAKVYNRSNIDIYDYESESVRLIFSKSF
jgi:hypothetical protein